MPPSEKENAHADRAASFVGRSFSFDAPTKENPRRRAFGVVTAARFVGLTERGKIPDFELTIKGQTGAVRVISLVEHNAQPKT